jgi:hypothetical protein
VFVVSGRGLCDWPIPRPEEFYRLWCVFECDHVKMKTLYTYCEQVGRRGKDYEMKQREWGGPASSTAPWALQTNECPSPLLGYVVTVITLVAVNCNGYRLRIKHVSFT